LFLNNIASKFHIYYSPTFVKEFDLYIFMIKTLSYKVLTNFIFDRYSFEILIYKRFFI